MPCVEAEQCVRRRLGIPAHRHRQMIVAGPLIFRVATAQQERCFAGSTQDVAETTSDSTSERTGRPGRRTSRADLQQRPDHRIRRFLWG